MRLIPLGARRDWGKMCLTTNVVIFGELTTEWSVNRHLAAVSTDVYTVNGRCLASGREAGHLSAV